MRCSVARRSMRRSTLDSCTRRRDPCGGSFRAVPDPAVPTTLDVVLDAEWLSDALDDIDDSDRIVGVEEVDSSKTLAQKVRLRVTVERGGRFAPDPRVLREGAPRRFARHRPAVGSALLPRAGASARRPCATGVLRGRRPRGAAGDHRHGRRRRQRRTLPERAHAVLPRHHARQPRPAGAAARRDLGMR